MGNLVRFLSLFAAFFAVATYNGSVGIIKGNAFLMPEFNYLLFPGNWPWKVRCYLSNEEMARLRGPQEGKSYVLKGKVEGVNNKQLSIDIRGCTVHDSP